MFGLFSSKPLLDESSVQWLFEAYAWALRSFGSDIFHEDTILVTPTDRHFPARANSAEEMASTAFGRVMAYAGMQNWPCELVQLAPGANPVVTPSIAIRHAPRGPAAIVSVTGETKSLPIAFDPQHIRKPHVLIAIFAQQLAYHLGRAAGEGPPGGEELRGPAADLLAIFMGFGLFLANSALTVCRGGCSGCGTSVQSLGYLTEDEFAYALAIFCALKNIRNEEVEPHLKKTLRPFYRMAVKEIGKTKAEDILRLGKLSHPIKPAAA